MVVATVSIADWRLDYLVDYVIVPVLEIVRYRRCCSYYTSALHLGQVVAIAL